MIDSFAIVVITLTVYSAISCVAYMISRENDDVLVFFGGGIVGWFIYATAATIRKLKGWYRNKDKRSVIQCPNGELKYCLLRDADDIYCWHNGYSLKKRYADKNEWRHLNSFSKDDLQQFKKNCDSCIHNRKECSDESIEACLCCLPKERWERKFWPEMDDTFPRWEGKVK